MNYVIMKRTVMSTFPPISIKTTNHWTQKRPCHLLMEIQVLDWDRDKN